MDELAGADSDSVRTDPALLERATLALALCSERVLGSGQGAVEIMSAVRLSQAAPTTIEDAVAHMAVVLCVATVRRDADVGRIRECISIFAGALPGSALRERLACGRYLRLADRMGEEHASEADAGGTAQQWSMWSRRARIGDVCYE
jgi:hypothetical protein